MKRCHVSNSRRNNGVLEGARPLQASRWRQVKTNADRNPPAPSKLGTGPHLLFLTCTQGQAQVERKLALDGGFLRVSHLGRPRASWRSDWEDLYLHCRIGGDAGACAHPVPTLIAYGESLTPALRRRWGRRPRARGSPGCPSTCAPAASPGPDKIRAVNSFNPKTVWVK